MTRTIAATLLAFAAFSLPALADPCQDDVAKIDTALKSQDVPTDTRAQVEDMRNQAVQLCGAGNTEEGLSMTGEAKQLLKLE